MNSPSLQSDSPKTGLAWFTLAAATCGLLLLSLWALFNQDQLFRSNQLPNDSVVNTATNAQAAAEKLAAEQAEAEKLAAEQVAAEKLAAEQAAAEKLAAEQAAAEKLAAEQAEAEKLAAEQAEAEKLAAEQAEAEKLAAEQAAAEKLAAEQAAAEKLAAERAEAEKLAAEQAEADRLAAETAQAEQLVRDQRRSIPSAAEPISNSVVAGSEQTPFERQRLIELSGLPSLSTQILFETRGLEPLNQSMQPLDRLFEILFLYSETTVTVQVSSNEYELSGNNELVSRERALTIVNYLIDRGLDEERFRIRALGQQRLPFGSHRVIVVATVIDE